MWRTGMCRFGIKNWIFLFVSLHLFTYAQGTMLISVADFVGVSKSTASRIVQDVSGAIAMLYNKYIKMHLNSVDKFFQYGQFPCVLGAIDCTHLRIQSLTQCEAGTFDNRWLLADSAYPNRSYILTPVLNPSNRNEQKYNDAHIATRNLIERTFGVWKRRFPVISLTMRLSLQNVQKVIIATAVLHNICRNYNMQDPPTEVELQTRSYTNDNDLHEPHSLVVEQDIRDRTELIEGYFSTV